MQTDHRAKRQGKHERDDKFIRNLIAIKVLGWKQLKHNLQ